MCLISFQVILKGLDSVPLCEKELLVEVKCTLCIFFSLEARTMMVSLEGSKLYDMSLLISSQSLMGEWRQRKSGNL